MVWAVYTLAQVPVTLRYTELLQFADCRRACLLNMLVNHTKRVLDMNEVPVEWIAIKEHVKLVNQFDIAIAGLYDYPA